MVRSHVKPLGGVATARADAEASDGPWPFEIRWEVLTIWDPDAPEIRCECIFVGRSALVWVLKDQNRVPSIASAVRF